MVGVAVNVTLLPAQMAEPELAEMLTAAAGVPSTVIVASAVIGEPHEAFVIVHRKE